MFFVKKHKRVTREVLRIMAVKRALVSLKKVA
jgi:hypothetical protein